MNSKEMNSISLIVFGGMGQIGMNLCAYKYADKYLIVDMGIGFDQELPGHNKVVVPDIHDLEKIKSQIAGIVVTHAHDDHIAAIPPLWPKLRVPIYATPFVAELIGRKTDDPVLKKSIVVTQQNKWIDIADFKVLYVPITHSIPESSALAIRTGGKTIVHTGDWKIDIDPVVGKTTDIKAFEKLGDEGVLALVCDSTNVLIDNEVDPKQLSEASVAADLHKLVAAAEGKRVFISCMSTNVARVKICYDVAKKCGRRLCLVGRSLIKVHEAAEVTGYWKQEDQVVIDDAGVAATRGTMVYMCTGSQGEIGSSTERISRDDHPSGVKAEPGDVVIISARTIQGNEHAVTKVLNRFALKGVSVTMPDAKNHLHVSGHPPQQDLKRMYKWTRPKFIIPAHGEPRHLLAHVELAKSCGIPATFVENGQEVAITESGITKIGTFKPGRFMIEGNVFLDVDGDELRKRKKLERGLVAVVIAGDAIKVDPIGLDQTYKSLEKTLVGVIKKRLEYLSSKRSSYYQTITDVMHCVIRWFKENQNRRPEVRVYIMNRSYNNKKQHNTPKETTEIE